MGDNFPNDYILARCANGAYDPYNLHLKELNFVRIEELEGSIVASVWVHVPTQTTIVAFRGTVAQDVRNLAMDANLAIHRFFGVGMDEEQIIPGFDGWVADLDRRIEQDPQTAGLPRAYTGHSLGSVVATRAAIRTNCDVLVTFDCPGVPAAWVAGGIRDFDALDRHIVYLSEPNLINTLHPHTQYCRDVRQVELMFLTELTIKWVLFCLAIDVVRLMLIHTVLISIVLLAGLGSLGGCFAVFAGHSFHLKIFLYKLLGGGGWYGYAAYCCKVATHEVDWTSVTHSMEEIMRSFSPEGTTRRGYGVVQQWPTTQGYVGAFTFGGMLMDLVNPCGAEAIGMWNVGNRRGMVRAKARRMTGYRVNW